MHEEHGWSLIMVFNANIAYMGMKEAMLGTLGNYVHHNRTLGFSMILITENKTLLLNPYSQTN